jgi:hypothetical protein
VHEVGVFHILQTWDILLTRYSYTALILASSNEDLGIGKENAA